MYAIRSYYGIVTYMGALLLALPGRCDRGSHRLETGGAGGRLAQGGERRAAAAAARPGQAGSSRTRRHPGGQRNRRASYNFV